MLPSSRPVILALLCAVLSAITHAAERPNILWLVCEDISPYLGSYGCTEAHTPHLDKLAREGIRFAGDNYIILHALNALQYGHLDDRLTKADWQEFKGKKTARTRDPHGRKMAARIIEDAISLFPWRRVVD